MSTFKADKRLDPIIAMLRERTKTEDSLIQFPEDLYESSLPKGLTMEDVNALEQHRADVINAATLVGGELALTMFEDDPDLQSISGGIDMGEKTKGVFTSVRSTLHNGETVYGSPRFVVNHSLPDKDGAATKIREHISRLAKEMFEE